MTKAPVVRAACAADAVEIAAFWNAAITGSTATFTTREKTDADIAGLIASAPMLVLAMGDIIKGFATYGPFRAGPGYADVAEHSVYLAPDATGAGHADALLEALETAAAQAGIRFFIAGISGDNTRASRFHARHGYVQTGHLPGIGQKFGRRLDLILMQKEIAMPR